MTRKRFWSKYRVLIFVSTGLFVWGTFGSFLHTLEDWGYGLLSYTQKRIEPKTRVVLVAIDAQALQAYGAWPWPRSELAQWIAKLQGVNPRSVSLLLDLSFPQTPQLHKQQTLDAVKERNENLRPQLLRLLSELDTDRVLSQSLAQHRTSFLGAACVPPDHTAKTADYWEQHKLQRSSRFKEEIPYLEPLIAPAEVADCSLNSPLEAFGQQAARMGFYIEYPNGATLSSIPLVLKTNDRLVPHLGLSLLAAQLKVKSNQIELLESGRLQVGKRIVNLGPDYRFYPKLSDNWHSIGDLTIYSAAELLKGLPAERLRDTHILIGLTAPGLTAQVSTPLGKNVPAAVWTAYAIQSLLNAQGVTVPNHAYLYQRLTLLALALYLLILPMRFYGRMGWIISGLLAVGVLNTGFILYLTQSLWIPLIVPVVFLLSTHFLLSLLYHRARALENARRETSTVRRELGVFYQSQGNLNQAFEQFRRCLDDGQIAKLVYGLGIDYERRRQFDKALEVYEHIRQQLNTFYKDSDTRITRLKQVTSNFPSSSPINGAHTQIMILDSPNMEKPMLGRYQLEREIGRGAMGMVYLGVDPKIARKVAIKTLTLGAEFEGKALEESEKRFFREAEAVGRLNHPNIVTIYDVGEDQKVAYIAMDYVEGEPLSEFIQEQRLLSTRTVVEIGIQVAEALDYAHRQKVIHRDIKPANIIYNQSTGVLKVTDFGIASLTDDSKTRTGTVLGSPSYMSPEQIAGKKITGHSDQFSLGVTLYQLLTGSVPFDGDSMANLMYQITNQIHRPIRKVRRGIPPCISRVINKTLQKLPENRFPDCKSVAEAFRKCIEGIS